MQKPPFNVAKAVVVSLLVAAVDWVVVFRVLPVWLQTKFMAFGIWVKPALGEQLVHVTGAVVAVWVLAAMVRLLTKGRGLEAWLFLTCGVCAGLGAAALQMVDVMQFTKMMAEEHEVDGVPLKYSLTSAAEAMHYHFWMVTGAVFLLAAVVRRAAFRPSPLPVGA